MGMDYNIIYIAVEKQEKDIDSVFLKYEPKKIEKIKVWIDSKWYTTFRLFFDPSLTRNKLEEICKDLKLKDVERKTKNKNYRGVYICSKKLSRIKNKKEN